MSETIANKDYEDEYKLRIALTNSTLSPNGSYHVQSLDHFNCGDIFIWEGNYYLVTGGTVLKRLSKYKSTAEYCNARLEYWLKEKVTIGYDDLNRPIRWRLTANEAGVMRKESNISVDENQVINLTDFRLENRIRDTIKNRESYAINQNIRLNKRWFKVADTMLLKNGIMYVSIKTTSKPTGFPNDL